MALLILVSCSSTNEWEVLFDGKTVQGLRGYRQTDFPSKDWVVVDGTLKTIPGHGVDLISENIYKDFELELEWKVSSCLLYTSPSPRDQRGSGVAGWGG